METAERIRKYGKCLLLAVAEIEMDATVTRVLRVIGTLKRQ